MATEGATILDALTLVRAEDHESWFEIELNRVEKRNALSHELVRQIVVAAQFAVNGLGRKVLVLSAAGPVFCAGADLRELRQEDIGVNSSPVEILANALLHLDAFVIVAVAKPVLGGGISILACCTIVLMAEDAWLEMPEIRYDMFPLAVVPYLPDAAVRRLVTCALTGVRVQAREAFEWGLVSEVANPEEIQGRVLHWVEIAVTHPRAAAQASAFSRSRFKDAKFASDYEHWRRKLHTEPGSTTDQMV